MNYYIYYSGISRLVRELLYATIMNNIVICFNLPRRSKTVYVGLPTLVLVREPVHCAEFRLRSFNLPHAGYCISSQAWQVTPCTHRIFRWWQCLRDYGLLHSMLKIWGFTILPLKPDRNHHSHIMLRQLPPHGLTLRPARTVCTYVTSVIWVSSVLRAWCNIWPKPTRSVLPPICPARHRWTRPAHQQPSEADRLKIPWPVRLPRYFVCQAQDLPEPMIVFKCPLCLVMVGRKAVVAHLKTVHQFERPDEFEFIPSRDVTPGRLTCAYCKVTFSVEFASAAWSKLLGFCQICPARWLIISSIAVLSHWPAGSSVDLLVDIAWQSVVSIHCRSVGWAADIGPCFGDLSSNDPISKALKPSGRPAPSSWGGAS